MRDVQQAYSRMAGLYTSLFGSVEQVDRADLALIERSLASVEGPVLDLGCGPGQLTGFLHSLGVDAAGIDLVPEFVAHARQAHPGVRFDVGSMTELDRPTGSVAGVLAWFSLIHLDPGSVDEVLCTIHRVLVPGGVLVLGFFDGTAIEPFEHKVVTAYRWPVDELAGRLARAGFVLVEQVQRPRDGDRRPYAALTARAV